MNKYNLFNKFKMISVVVILISFSIITINCNYCLRLANSLSEQHACCKEKEHTQKKHAKKCECEIKTAIDVPSKNESLKIDIKDLLSSFLDFRNKSFISVRICLNKIILFNPSLKQNSPPIFIENCSLVI